MAEALTRQTYFARPYHSWERGLNENHNGLLRQYFPKQQLLDQVRKDDVDHAIAKLNNRPRKTLDFKTPGRFLSNSVLGRTLIGRVLHLIT